MLATDETHLNLVSDCTHIQCEFLTFSCRVLNIQHLTVQVDR